MEYFYKPIQFFNGDVLKCAGICDDTNRDWFIKANAGTVIVDGYKGDRINASDLTPFAG
jgi:hypothetical protein